MRLEGLGTLKKKKIKLPHRDSNPGPSGSSILPQPTTLKCANDDDNNNNNKGKVPVFN
jgi:hypothetical protein